MIVLARSCPYSAPYFNLTTQLCCSFCGVGQYTNNYEICQLCDSVCKMCSWNPSNCT